MISGTRASIDKSSATTSPSTVAAFIAAKLDVISAVRPANIARSRSGRRAAPRTCSSSTASSDMVDLARKVTPQLEKVCRIRHQPALFHRRRGCIMRGQAVFGGDRNQSRQQRLHERIVGNPKPLVATDFKAATLCSSSDGRLERKPSRCQFADRQLE